MHIMCFIVTFAGVIFSGDRKDTKYTTREKRFRWEITKIQKTQTNKQTNKNVSAIQAFRNKCINAQTNKSGVSKSVKNNSQTELH